MTFLIISITTVKYNKVFVSSMRELNENKTWKMKMRKYSGK